MPSLNAADIAWHMRQYAAGLRHEWITPNAHLYAWESDLLTVTPQGHVCEVEIKISRNDLRNDLLKAKHSQGMLLNGSLFAKSTGVGLTAAEAFEHARQAAGATTCRRPNYFCFAMPCAVFRATPALRIPPYAGVYTVDDQGRVFEERRPIQLHTERIAHADLLALARKMHQRYWNMVARSRPDSTFDTVDAEAVLAPHGSDPDHRTVS
jgi:hypothetical protein